MRRGWSPGSPRPPFGRHRAGVPRQSRRAGFSCRRPPPPLGSGEGQSRFAWLPPPGHRGPPRAANWGTRVSPRPPHRYGVGRAPLNLADPCGESHDRAAERGVPDTEVGSPRPPTPRRDPKVTGKGRRALRTQPPRRLHGGTSRPRAPGGARPCREPPAPAPGSAPPRPQVPPAPVPHCVPVSRRRE